MRGTAGQLLVSIPDLGDENFDQSVVLVIEHDEQGALGLVLNHPSATPVVEHLPTLEPLLASPAVFFLGGPVAVGGLLALGRRRLDRPATHATEVAGPVVLVEPQALVDDEVDGLDVVRMFTGYSGWAPGQLDAELASGAWHLLGPMPDDVFTSDPDHLWRSVMRRQGGRLASQGMYPDDLSVN